MFDLSNKSSNSANLLNTSFSQSQNARYARTPCIFLFREINNLGIPIFLFLIREINNLGMPILLLLCNMINEINNLSILFYNMIIEINNFSIHFYLFQYDYSVSIYFYFIKKKSFCNTNLIRILTAL